MTDGQLDTYSELTYTTSLLGIFAQCFAKFSMAFLYKRIAPQQNKLGIRILLGTVSVWIVFAVFAIAFACGGDASWGAECPTNDYVLPPVAATNFIRSVFISENQSFG